MKDHPSKETSINASEQVVHPEVTSPGSGSSPLAGRTSNERLTLGKLVLQTARGEVKERVLSAEEVADMQSHLGQILEAKRRFRFVPDETIDSSKPEMQPVETTEKPADPKRDEKLRQVSLATMDAKLLGCGFVMILPDNSFQHVPLDRIQIKPESSPVEPACEHPIEKLFHHGFVSGKPNDYRCDQCNAVINLPNLDQNEWLKARSAEKAGCALCAEGMNSFADPATGNRMHARNGVVTVCTAQNGK